MIQIPTRTKMLLEKSSKHHGFVLECIRKVEPWLSDNKTIFFPEYTDHGLTHLNEVMLTADSIISDESWNHMTAQDAAAIIVSVLLHDCAMHLTEDGFYALIQDKLPEVNSRHIGREMRWSEVWHDYFSEAKRFDATKLNSIFGDETPVKPIPQNKLDLTGRDRLLIGEFIRRYHARIAHEIAFYGIPGIHGPTIQLGNEPEANFLDLCGFIARSHNMSLRSAVDRLEKHKKQVHLNTHVPFIMLVLRIADFIQIHAERAPQQLLSLKTIVSPISRGEWKKHHSIVEINQAHEDPEAIYIDAEPEDPITFVELKKLFSEIQTELDLSWSVLGEVYGRYNLLKDLGITIRRIRSSLDYLDEFLSEKKPKYIPRVLSFKTADSEMMELLISPLYGDKPEIGIRELMQNSVDACSELKDYIVKQGDQFENNIDYDVCITLHNYEDQGRKLVIEDYGIGMTLDVVENYFLNIGASFRNSDRWKKEHETDGHSNVYRTGRFGIGLLAAYLLGEKLHVETRHISQKENQALSFECSKGSKSIIVSNTTFHVGTRITIDLSQEVADHLWIQTEEWDWYSLDTPRVERKKVNHAHEHRLEQSRLVPSSDQNIENTNWRRTVADGYDDITWTYDEVGNNSHRFRDSASLICNGVIINDSLFLNSFNISKKMNLIQASTPTINVFDQDGRLPINLERSSLVNRSLPFMEEIAKDISNYLAKELVAFCNRLSQVNLDKELLYEISNISVAGLDRSRYSDTENVAKFIISLNGLMPSDFDLIAMTKIKTLYIDPVNLSKNRGAWSSSEFIGICDNYLMVDKVSDTKQSRTSFVRKFFELNTPSYYKPSGIAALPIRSRRILIKKADVQDIVSPGYVPKTFWNRLECDWENDIWVLMSIGSVPAIDFDIAKLAKELSESESFGLIISYLNWDKIPKDENEGNLFFSSAWLDQNGGTYFTP